MIHQCIALKNCLNRSSCSTEWPALLQGERECEFLKRNNHCHYDCGLALAIDRSDVLCRKARWQHNFQHFNIVTMAKFTMANIGRLVNARPRFEANDSLALIFKFDPAFQDVHQLKLGLVKMRLA